MNLFTMRDGTTTLDSEMIVLHQFNFLDLDEECAVIQHSFLWEVNPGKAVAILAKTGSKSMEITLNCDVSVQWFKNII